MSAEHRLRYTTPSTSFTTGLPLGNGHLGASVLSSPAQESFILNHIAFWSGAPHTAGSDLTSRPADPKAELRETQRYLLAGKYAEGEKKAKTWLESAKNNFGTHLGIGTLDIAVGDNGDHDSLQGFQRELRLDEALSVTKYEKDGYWFQRKSFVSYPHQVLVVNFETNSPDGLKLAVGVHGENGAFAVKAEGGRLLFDAHALETVHSDGTCGVKGHGVAGVTVDDGEVESRDGKVIATAKKNVTVLLAFNTDYQQKDEGWREQSARQVAEASRLSVAELLAAHLADYQLLYRRTSITLGNSSSTAGQTTNHRREKLEPSAYADPGMFALYFHYARYLTIAGTRATSPLPLHLQGLWNDGEACRMGWSCDYHLDINTQMNYFATLTSGLPDLMEPLVSYLASLAVAGKDAARACYGCDGWVAHVFSNVWGFADPGWDISYGLNVTGGLWMASHLMEMYEYTQDGKFLAQSAYPILKGAAEFFLDYMVEDPKTGWLVSGPAVSPENSFFVAGEDGAKEEHCLSLSPTLDVALLRDLFAFCAYAAKRLDVDHDLAQNFRDAQAKMPPFQIGSNGQLQEWLYDFEEAQPFHRHLSHTMALCRSALISSRHTPDLAKAIAVTLARRQGRDDLEDIEFTAALFGMNYARLGDAEQALAQIGHLVGQLSFDNLLSYSKPGVAGAEKNIFVVDGNFGGAAVIAEMLARSVIPVGGGTVEIDLLPCLPKTWSEGTVKGLRLRGNLELSMEWAVGKLERATLKAFSPGSMTVYYEGHQRSTTYEADGVIRLDQSLTIS